MHKKPIIWILSDKKSRYESQLTLASGLIKNFDLFFLITFNNKLEFSNYQDLIKISKKNILEKSNSNIGQKPFRLSKKIFNNIPLEILYYLGFLFFKKKKVKNILFRQKPKIIFLSGDRSGPSYETILLLLAKEHKINVVLPYLSSINSGKTVRIKNSKTFKLNFLSKILIGSNYKFIHKSEYYGFYTLSQYIVLKIVNCITKNPFSIGNHPNTSILCLDTPLTLSQISNYFKQNEKVRFVGRHEYNFLAKNQNNEKENILLSLPPLFEHKIIDWNTHIKFICETINIITNEYRLVISLHPKTEYKNYKFLEKKYNCIITSKPIQNELVKSKLFICANSSIAIWSTLLGIRTIILDFFDLDTSMFKNLNTLKYVDTYGKLRNEIKSDTKIDYSQDWRILNKKKLFSEKSKTKMDQILETLLV